MFDKRDLDLAVRDQLRPVLKKAGFDRFARRNAWRITPEAIDIVSVQLMPEQEGDDGFIGPSRIFFVHFACRDRRGWPGSTSTRTGRWMPTRLPNDYDCDATFRYGLDAPRYQPTWEVTRDGSNLPSLVKAMIEHIVIDGLPWFEGRHAQLRSAAAT